MKPVKNIKPAGDQSTTNFFDDMHSGAAELANLLLVARHLKQPAPN
jgi:hypothetical protein